ncbi:MAG: asparagine synthase-related protein [Alphaproteobacteria bacterium]
MSYFAAYVGAAEGSEAGAIRDACRRAVARTIAPSEIAELSVGDLFVAYWRPGCEVHRDGDTGCLGAGDIIVPGSSSTAEDASRIAASIGEGGAAMLSLLRDARGSFALIAWSADGARVCAATDFVGVYPVYYARLGSGVLITTSLGFVRDILGADARYDRQGVLEKAAFGYPLGDRTPLAGVHALESAEAILVDPEPRRVRYWDWFAEDVEEEPDLDKLARDVHGALVESVRVRVARVGAEFCQLSGGMDSRMIAFLLAEAGHAPTLLSYGSKETYDLALATEIAKRLPGRHYAHVLDASSVASVGGNDRVTAELIDEIIGHERGRRPIWCGQGGSVVLGGTYLSEVSLPAVGEGMERMAEVLRDGLHAGFSARVVRLDGDAKNFVRNLIFRELARFDIRRRDQVPYRFLMTNDQRRHQHSFVERAVETRVQFISPILDAAVVKQMLRCPAVEVPLHRFYTRLFELLPAAARSVAWQTYPGHAPCPLPPPEGLSSQFRAPALRRDAQAQRRMSWKLICAVASPGWPSDILRRAPALAAAVEGVIGLGRYSYVVRAAYSVLDWTRIPPGELRSSLPVVSRQALESAWDRTL